MADTRGIQVINKEEKLISKHDNEEIVKRTVIAFRDGNEVKITTDLKRVKERKVVPEAVAERMRMPKFGACAGQQRGTLEPGVVQVSKEVVRIINRMTDVEQDLKDKLKETLSSKRETLMNEMKNALEREQYEKLLKLKDQNKPVKREYRKRENTIKVEGFNPNYTVEKIYEIFSTVGEIKQIVYPMMWKSNKRKNVVYITYEQSISFNDAMTKFHDQEYDGCVLFVTEAN